MKIKDFGRRLFVAIVTEEAVEQEYTKPPVDWNKVKVDTPILVKDHSGASWVHRHFARYSNGVVHAWIDGKTSWTEDIVNEWNFAKLAESRVNDH
nr:MAG TPA: hypothetical protein [Caudoviricetes sp.]